MKCKRQPKDWSNDNAERCKSLNKCTANLQTETIKVKKITYHEYISFFLLYLFQWTRKMETNECFHLDGFVQSYESMR